MALYKKGQGGRPKGAKNLPKSKDAIAVAAMAKVFRQETKDLLAKSQAILMDDLEAVMPHPEKPDQMIPDTKLRRETARFLYGKLAPAPAKAKAFIEGRILDVLNSTEDVEAASRKAVVMAGVGELSVDDAEAMQRLLSNHMGIAGFLQVDELRKELEALVNAKTINGQLSMPEEGQLTWGKGYVAPTHQGTDTPAE